MRSILSRIHGALKSRRFFWFILVFFLLESLWIALSAAYPQAFDEDFHFGIIKLYSHHWLPFLTSQPAGADEFGAVFRDPSYLYHYLMSFPYRIVAHFAHTQMTQVIILRVINVGLAALGLILFRRVLLRVKLSQALTNVSLLLFVLIPIVPQLAGQINYDNMLFPLVAWTFLLTIRAIDELVAKRPSIRTWMILLTVCLLSSLVKYEFLPIALATVLFLVYMTFKNFKGSWRLLRQQLGHSWRAQKVWQQIILVLALVIGLGLFAQRDGINLVRYHTLEPDCRAVLNVKSCSSYSPWNASYKWHLKVVEKASSGDPFHFVNPLAYTATWFYWLWYRLFFAINGPSSGFRNYPPLPLPAIAAALISLFGVVVVFLRRKILKTNPYLLFFALVIVFYMLALWLEGYLQYRYTHVLVLMNGRYLLPILLPVAAIGGAAMAKTLRHRPTLKVLLATVAIVMFIQGGGVMTFILRSDSTWDWPNTTVVKANNAARDVLKTVVLAGTKTYSTKVWVFN